MPSLKIVLNTNALLLSISRRSAFSIVLDKLYENAFELYITTEIQLEYEEKLASFFSEETTESIHVALRLLPNVRKIEVYFRLELIIADPDDNKFSDCAFAGNVHYLVTDDKHFNVLKSVPFPSINIISLEAFKKLLIDSDKK